MLEMGPNPDIDYYGVPPAKKTIRKGREALEIG